MNNTTQSLTVIVINSKRILGRFQFYVYRDLSLGFYLCLCSRSDNSENANQMHLSIHSKPPGFNVNMLSIPLEERQEKTLSNYFLGFNSVTEVAIESYTVVGNTIVYVEYNDEPSLKMVKEIGLDSLKDIPQSYRQKKLY
jgi:peptide/nickel transport system permease protein